eukprot:361013-Chlamydomonas_euryale.AAC.10
MRPGANRQGGHQLSVVRARWSTRSFADKVSDCGEGRSPQSAQASPPHGSWCGPASGGRKECVSGTVGQADGGVMDGVMNKYAGWVNDVSADVRAHACEGKGNGWVTTMDIGKGGRSLSIWID